MKTRTLNLNLWQWTLLFRASVFLALISLIILPASAQVKIGDNPTQITPSAILELNSTNQGFLMPRLTDWQIDAVFGSNIPDGMMVYYDKGNDDSSGVYLRQDGKWSKITTSENQNLNLWSRSGNTIQPGTPDTLGTLNASDMRIITNNTERILLTSDGLVRFTVDSVAINGRLSVTGAVRMDSVLRINDTLFAEGARIHNQATIEGELIMPNVAGQSLFNEVLVIDTATGVVTRRSIDLDVFKGWTIGDFDSTGNSAGMELRNSANGVDKDTLVLHAASETNPGGVSTTTQKFAGHKSFVDSVTAEKSLLVGASGTAAKATLEVQGSMAMKVNTVSVNYNISDKDHTIVITANNIEANLPAPNAGNEGRVYVIKKMSATDFSGPVRIRGNIEGNGSAEMHLYNQGTSLKLQSTGASGTWLIIDRM